MRTPAMSPASYEAVFELLDREIWIVTAASNASRGGLVATWVTQASIDPERPLVCAGIAPNHFTGELIRQSGRFALHLLREDQTDVAYDFATGSGRDRDKLAPYTLRDDTEGVPVLADCLAWIVADVVHTMDGGDRWYFWGWARQGGRETAERPLREKAFFQAGRPEQLAPLKENREHDIAEHRPLFAEWLRATANAKG